MGSHGPYAIQLEAGTQTRVDDRTHDAHTCDDAQEDAHRHNDDAGKIVVCGNAGEHGSNHADDQHDEPYVKAAAIELPVFVAEDSLRQWPMHVPSDVARPSEQIAIHHDGSEHGNEEQQAQKAALSKPPRRVLDIRPCGLEIAFLHCGSPFCKARTQLLGVDSLTTKRTLPSAKVYAPHIRGLRIVNAMSSTCSSPVLLLGWQHRFARAQTS